MIGVCFAFVLLLFLTCLIQSIRAGAERCRAQPAEWLELQWRAKCDGFHFRLGGGTVACEGTEQGRNTCLRGKAWVTFSSCSVLVSDVDL